ncbi:Decaprenyl diphosphate synthase-like, partial [Trema orientale]
MNQYGIRVHFIGNLKILNDSLRFAAQKVMKATAKNKKASLFVRVAYTSCDEIVHPIQEACKCKINKIQTSEVSSGESEETWRSIMYTAVAPDPDILIRSSGETRLSNFLLWQTAYCPFYSPVALWLELGLWHLVWGSKLPAKLPVFGEEKEKH